MGTPENPRPISSEIQGRIPTSYSVLGLIREIELFGLRQKAEKYLNRRGFLAIFQDRADKLGGRIIRPDMAIRESRPHNLIAEDSAFLAIVWDEEEKARGESVGKTIFVEALQNGNIIIHGNPAGTTILDRKDLSNKINLMKALGKAEEKPAIMLILNYADEEE